MIILPANKFSYATNKIVYIYYAHRGPKFTWICDLRDKEIMSFQKKEKIPFNN